MRIYFLPYRNHISSPLQKLAARLFFAKYLLVVWTTLVKTHKCAYSLQEKCRKAINIQAGAAYSYHCSLTDHNFMVVKSDLRCAESCQHQTTRASLNSWMPQANRFIQTVQTSGQIIHFKTSTWISYRLPGNTVLLAQSETKEEEDQENRMSMTPVALVSTWSK